MIRLSRTAALAAAWGLVGAASGRAPDQFWQLPDGAIASWSVDPGALGTGAPDHNRALADAAVSWIAHTCVGATESHTLAALLRQDVIGPAPYRLVLIKFEATCPQPKRGEPSPAQIDALEAVLEVVAPADAPGLVKSVRLAAGGSESTAPAERALDVPGLDEGRTLTRGLATVQWGRAGDSVLVGFGERSLEHWLEATRRADRFVRAHDRALKREESPAFQAWVNLNSLRTDAPELFAYGRLAPLIEPWNLSNSRSLYIAGRIVAADGPWRPPLLSIDAAWSPRSEPTTSIHTMELTERVWPAELGAKVPADAPYAAVVKGDWRLVFDAAIGTAETLSPTRVQFQAKLKRWQAQQASAVVETLRGLGERAVVIGPSLTTPEAPAAVIELRPGVARFDKRLSDLCNSLGPVVTKSGTNGWELKSGTTPLAPWDGLGWRLSDDRKWITFSWSAPKSP